MRQTVIRRGTDVAAIKPRTSNIAVATNLTMLAGLVADNSAALRQAPSPPRHAARGINMDKTRITFRWIQSTEERVYRYYDAVPTWYQDRMVWFDRWSEQTDYYSQVPTTMFYKRK